jgi:hypothetical protein
VVASKLPDAAAVCFAGVNDATEGSRIEDGQVVPAPVPPHLAASGTGGMEFSGAGFDVLQTGQVKHGTLLQILQKTARRTA